MACCTLPDNITCILENNYSVNATVINGFGDSLLDRPTVTATFAFTTQTDIHLFMYWVIFDLGNGTLPFILDVPIFGKRLLEQERQGTIMDGWKVAFADTDFLQTKLKGFTSELSVKLILLDDITGGN